MTLQHGSTCIGKEYMCNKLFSGGIVACQEMDCSHRDSDCECQYEQRPEMAYDTDTHHGDITHAIIKLKQTLQCVKDQNASIEELAGMFYWENFTRE